MASSRSRIRYVCTVCGGQQSRWMGQCPHCGSWGSLEETAPQTSTAAGSREQGAPRPSPLEEVDQSVKQPVSTGSDPVDSLLGEGLMPGSVLLLGGDPGVGKSTFVLQLMGGYCRQGGSAVYITGEETLAQVQQRAQRLEVLGSGIRALYTTRLEDILALLESDPPGMLVVDSIQTLASGEAEGTIGSPAQVKACASALTEAARSANTALLLLGHVTKEGQIAGPKLLEHMVDTVLYLEGEKQQTYRVLRAVKNRFGPTSNLLVLTMVQQGLHIVHDPSTFFLRARDPELSGTAVVMAMEGQRAFAIEVQALASRSFFSVPRRTSLGFDTNRLHLLLALMEKKLNLDMAGVDLYARIGGGLRLQEPALDLGIMAAVLSSYYDRALPARAVFWGEVDLSGQIRPVAGQDSRIRQARQLGFRPIYCPGEGSEKARDLVPLDNVFTLLAKLFS